MRIPGARVVSTVAATGRAAAASPITSRPRRGDEQVDHVLVAATRAAVVGQGDDDQDEAAEPRPEAGGGEAGEGQRAGADLQRDDGDGDAEQQRDEHAEDEGDAEGDEHLRQRAGVEQRVAAVDPLGARAARRGTAAPARASSEQPMKLRPMTLESLDVSHEARPASGTAAWRRRQPPRWGRRRRSRGRCRSCSSAQRDITGPASPGSEIAREARRPSARRTATSRT